MRWRPVQPGSDDTAATCDGEPRRYDAKRVAVTTRRRIRTQVRILERSASSRARRRDAVADGASAPADKPVLEVVGGRGRLSRESLREFWHFREVQLAFATRQLKVRYKQAVVGAGWVVLQPLIAAGIFALFLGRYASLPSEGVPYFLLALGGMAAWGYFSSVVNTGADSLVANQNLLRKIFFPREILPLTPVLSGLVDLAIALLIFVCATAAFGIWPALSWLALPVPALILVTFAAACALGLSSLNVYYRDVRYVLPFVLQLGLFASPVAYSLSLIPSGWRELYAIVNPIAAAIDALRRIVLHGQWPDPSITVGALAWSLVLLLLASLLFKRLERSFADRV
jgi:lipopolysaccharide transport system permease protein